MTGNDFWVQSMKIGAMFGCHQMPERSFAVRGYQFPLCSRCTGLFLGEGLAIFTPLVRHLPRSLVVSSAMVFPTALDGATQYIGMQKSNNRRRFLTGLLAGIGMVSIYKNLLTRGTRK